MGRRTLTYATHRLGIFYRLDKTLINEDDVSKRNKAIAYCKKAIALGFPSYCSLGLVLEDAKDEKGAFEAYQMGAKAGNRSAIWNLSCCYRSGFYVAQDLRKAYKLNELGARLGESFSFAAYCQYGSTISIEQRGKYFRLAKMNIDEKDFTQIPAIPPEVTPPPSSFIYHVSLAIGKKNIHPDFKNKFFALCQTEPDLVSDLSCDFNDTREKVLGFFAKNGEQELDEEKQQELDANQKLQTTCVNMLSGFTLPKPLFILIGGYLSLFLDPEIMSLTYDKVEYSRNGLDRISNRNRFFYLNEKVAQGFDVLECMDIVRTAKRNFKGS